MFDRTTQIIFLAQGVLKCWTKPFISIPSSATSLAIRREAVREAPTKSANKIVSERREEKKQTNKQTNKIV